MEIGHIIFNHAILRPRDYVHFLLHPLQKKGSLAAEPSAANDPLVRRYFDVSGAGPQQLSRLGKTVATWGQ